MSYSANQYNYATPLSSSGSLVSSDAIADKKYFLLSNNVLDGSCYPISGDVGIWGAALPNSDGTLSEPFVVTVEESATIHAFRLVGSQYCYPVAFTVQFYNGSALLHTVAEELNDSATYIAYLPKTLSVTKYVITVTKVSSSNSPVRLLNVYNPAYIKRVELLTTDVSDTATIYDEIRVLSTDALRVAADAGISHVHNTINVMKDTTKVHCTEDSELTNVHTIMKQPFRRVYGKVYVTYTDPMLDDEVTISASNEAYNSMLSQVLDGETEPDSLLFTLYDNNLSGRYRVGDESSQVGWVSSEISNSFGRFDNPPELTIRFAARPIVSLVVSFDDTHENLVRDFTVILTKENGATVTYTYTDNNEAQVQAVTDEVADVVSVTIRVTRVHRPYSPAVIVDVPISSTILYRGYDDVSELMSVDLLEELTYEDAIEALGGVSANEITVVLDNSDKKFFFNSGSIVARQLKRNRKIVPWLGVEVVPGEIEWYTLGTFWSYNWDVPVNGLTTTVVGFDTIGLLSTTDFHEHHAQIGKSLGQLIEYVLEDAKRSLHFIEYVIEPALYDVIIPYAWFEHGSHAAALRKISLCYPMHIYCDRQGRICAATQKLHLDYYYDIWANDKNIIDTKYKSLYTTLPNIVNVEVCAPVLEHNKELVNDSTLFSVDDTDTRTLTFGAPYVSGLSVVIDCDSTVNYTYAVYSWGIDISFTGTGSVRSIACTGTCVDVSTKSVISKRNAESVRLNGAVTRDVKSDFIQTSSLANFIVDRLFALSENDKYDASVVYRGDISLSINDPILLQDGIAPDNRYNIKRHQLSWSGFLTGSAELNT